jgi:pimeloyl-ACP methyl ester carboxylesterase
MWATFADVEAWHRWNPCIWRARIAGGGGLRVGARLEWVFNAIRGWYPYKLPATAEIVDFEPGRRVTWEVRIAGLHALHSYMVEPVDAASCRFGSAEIAEGPGFRLLRAFWLAHFHFVCRTSLEGARRLGETLRPEARLRAYGEPSDRTPVVVVPGIDGSIGSVAPILERLSRSRRVLLADYSTERNLTLEALAAELVALVAEETDGPVDLLGQSIGSIVAAHLAVSHGIEVRKVVLMSPFTRTRTTALRVSNAVSRVSPRPLYRLTVGPLMAAVCGPVGDGWGHPFLRAVGRSDPADSRRRTAWQIGRDYTPDLAAVARPTRVLMGAHDRFVPDAAVEIAALRAVFGEEAVVAIPHAGHVLLPTAAVDRAVAEIEAFLG